MSLICAGAMVLAQLSIAMWGITLFNSMNDSSNATSTDQVTFGETAFYVTNGSVGAIFNVVVLYIALRYIDTDDKPRQIIVINMTFADLLMCLVYMLTRPILSEFPIFLCNPYYITIWTIQLVSTLNLVWLNLDKLLYIQFPLHYYSMVNRKRLLVLSAISWVVMILIAITVCTSVTILDACSSVLIDFKFYIPICVMYAVMILASFIISAIIYFIAHSSTSMEARQRSRLFQRLFFLFSSTLWTFFTCLPYRLLYITWRMCAELGLDNCSQNEVIHHLITLFFRILVIGTVINPVITIATQRIYRQRLLKMFGQFKDRRISEDTAITISTRRASSKGTCIENAALTSHL